MSIWKHITLICGYTSFVWFFKGGRSKSSVASFPRDRTAGRLRQLVQHCECSSLHLTPAVCRRSGGVQLALQLMLQPVLLLASLAAVAHHVAGRAQQGLRRRLLFLRIPAHQLAHMRRGVANAALRAVHREFRLRPLPMVRAPSLLAALSAVALAMVHRVSELRAATLTALLRIGVNLRQLSHLRRVSSFSHHNDLADRQYCPSH